MLAFARWFLVFPLVLASILAQAAVDIPSPLEPWRGWVMHDQAWRTCPLIAGQPGNTAGDFLCAWPGVLSVAADAHGAELSQHWQVDVDSWIPLPGDRDHWPQQVMIDGVAAVVVDRNGPVLRLAAGRHEIRATIPWQQRPQSLHVPAVVGQVALRIDGAQVDAVQRTGDELTLGRGSTNAQEADSIELQVYRRLSDGVPALLDTQVQFVVSGQAREELIGPVLPDGFAPLTLDSEWPARLDSDGRLRVRVQPGTNTIAIAARAIAPLVGITAHPAPSPWPPTEIWSYAADAQLRVSVAEGASPIDPRQAQVPAAWANLPAFALAEGEQLKIEERSRGLDAQASNRLGLRREMWLDFDGRGWFARDLVQGTMLKDWRFDVALPYALQRAEDHGEALLVTRGAQAGTSGVEWRSPDVALGAGLRIARTGSRLPVTGWQDTFERVNATLHLPNGYRLLGAPGADSARGSWLSQWSLFDVFIAALLALLAWRAFGLVGGLVAIVYLVLGYQEAGAPRWILLAALAFVLIVRSLPAGRLSHGIEWLRRATLAVLVLAALPFAAVQVRDAIYPQLENDGALAVGRFAVSGEQAVGTVTMIAPQDAADEVKMTEESASPPVLARASAPESNATNSPNVSGKRVGQEPRYRIDRYSQSTVLQTGSGEPGWQIGSRYDLAWSGPVGPGQTVQLLIAPPWLVRLLRIALVSVLAWLLARLLRPAWNAWREDRAATHMLFGAFALAGSMLSTDAHAQAFPPPDLLAELRTRLLVAPDCAPACVSLAQAEVSASGDEIRIAIQAHALERVALPLPASNDGLVLQRIDLDGVAQDGMARHEGRSWLALPRGVHRIGILFTATADKVALAFPLQPMRILFQGDGWQASGLHDDRLQTETLALVRAHQTDEEPIPGSQQFAPFVRVDRSLELGLDWTAQTTVTRLAPRDGGITLALPLLPGEHVTTAKLNVDGANVDVSLADGAQTTTWASTLDKTETLRLTAPAITDHAETWHVRVSPTWHMEFAGVPAVAMQVGRDLQAARDFEFHPLPGETLAITITRPVAVPGPTRAIDAAHLSYAVGKRSADTTLVLSVRASQGGEQSINLPHGAELLGVRRDGQELNLRMQGDTLSLPMTPGTHAFDMRWRTDTPVGVLARTPSATPGLPAANITLDLTLPADRWLLATGGPGVGPAVLLWSELVVMLLLAWALTRTRHSPLRFWQWVLLGLGFSMFSWIALLVVAAWQFAFDLRARFAPRSALAFNAIQVGLVALAMIALLCLLGAVKQGLLGAPDMVVAGNGSSAHALHWFVDRSSDTLPSAYAISLPLWVLKLAMLAWALWLASALVGWLRSGFAAWMHDGYWRRIDRPTVDIPIVEPPPQVQS